MVPTANRSSSKRSKNRASRSSSATAEQQRVTTLAPVIDDLAALGATDHWVVSCYLKLEPRDRSRGKYLIKLKNRIKWVLATLEDRGIDRAGRKAVEHDLERIRDYLEHQSNLPPGNGIAVFACEPLGLFKAITLARVFRSRLCVDRSPQIRELAALNDEFGRVVCVVYDRTEARFFELSAGDIAELPGISAGDTTRTSRFRGPSGSATHRGRSEPRGRGVGGSALGEHNYNQRIREEKHRHYAQVAQRLFELIRQGVRGIVLGGTGADVSAVEPHLHPYVRDAVLGTAKLNPKTVGTAEVIEAALEVREKSERVWEERHVQELREGLGARWAVDGIEAVLQALNRGQVRTLLVDPSAEQAGYRCRESGRLALRLNGCAAEGDAEPVADLIDEAIEEALRQGSHVEVVEGEARGQVHGLAALLRFKVV
jgi:peptide chain release factor subunit 1